MPLNHREWTMQEMRRREPLRDDVTRLHQLQRQLVRIRVSETATNNDTVFHEHVTLYEFDYRRLLVERARDEFRDRFVRKRHRARRQLSREHIKKEHLAGERLRRRDGALASTVREQYFVDEMSHRGTRLVGDADGVSAGAPRVFENAIDVFTFTRLRNADDERVVQS